MFFFAASDCPQNDLLLSKNKIPSYILLWILTALLQCLPLSTASIDPSAMTAYVTAMSLNTASLNLYQIVPRKNTNRVTCTHRHNYCMHFSSFFHNISVTFAYNAWSNTQKAQISMRLACYLHFLYQYRQDSGFSL